MYYNQLIDDYYDPYEGLTLDDVLTDEEKEEMASKKERELFYSPPSMESLDISYRTKHRGGNQEGKPPHLPRTNL